MNNLLSDVNNSIDITLIRSHMNINDFDDPHQMALDTDTSMRNCPLHPSLKMESPQNRFS